MSSSTTCRFEELVDRATGSETDAHIFVVPGIGTSLPKDWKHEHRQPWLVSLANRLAKEGQGCAIVAYRHSLSTTVPSSWSEIQQCGQDLLHDLQAYRRSKNLKDRPIVLVCHSLGGLIAKHALVYAVRLNQDYQSLYKAIQGIVFISSPHLLEQPDQAGQEWQRAPAILSIGGRRIDKQLYSNDDLQCLAVTCRQFKDLPLYVPILSIYEIQDTKVKDANHRTTRICLVNEKTATIGREREEVLPVNCAHDESCLLDEKPTTTHNITSRVKDWLPGAQGDSLASKLHDLPALNLTHTLSLQHTRIAPENKAVSETTLKKGSFNSKSMPRIGFPGLQRQGPFLPCSNVDHARISELFLAREDTLKALDKVLAPSTDKYDSSSVRYVGLFGIGGIGKTSTAKKYAQLCESTYDASFLIRADTREKLMDGFSRIAVMLKLLDENQTQDRAFNRKLVKDWLENPVRYFDTFHQGQTNTRLARWLIIFDNVENIEDIDEFCPTRGGGSIIVTSRNPLAAWRPQGLEQGNEGIQMMCFDEDEAVDLLRRMAPNAEKRGHAGAAAELARRLDCLPLALRQMGEIIHRKQMTFKRFLDIYEDESSHNALFSSVRRLTKSSYNHTISTVWAIEQLDKKTLSLLNVLALLDPDGIKESIVLPGASMLADPMYPGNDLEFEDARAELSSSSLIYNNIDEEELSLHRTVQDCVRAKMSSKQLHIAFETAVTLLLREWPLKARMWHYPVDNWPKCAALSSHLIKLHGHLKSMTVAPEQRTITRKFPELLMYGGWYFHQRGAVDQADSFFTTSEEMCHLLSDEESILSDLWFCRGALAAEINDGESTSKYQTKLLDMTKERIPSPKTADDHGTLAVAYNEMGIGHMMCGRVDDAVELFENAQIHSGLFKKRSDMIFSQYMFACTNLGLAQWMQQRNEDALSTLTELYSQYAKRRLVDKEASWVPGRLMHAIGNVKVSLGELEKGLEWHQAAWKLYVDTIGEGHHRTADVCHRLADDYMRQQDYPEARRFIQRALKVFDSKTCYLPEKMRTTHLLGLLCEAEGKTVEGSLHLDEATALYRVLKKERKEEIPTRALTAADYDASITFWSR